MTGLDIVGLSVPLKAVMAGNTIVVDPSLPPSSNFLFDGFIAGPTGDRLDFGDFLARHLVNWDRSTNPFATGHLRLRQEGDNVVIRMDIDGGGDLFNYSLFTFTNLRAADFDTYNLFGYSPRGADVAADAFTGSAAADQFVGGYGSDVINGGGGDDVLSGRLGRDTIDGGDGNDRIDGGDATDILRGAAGDDVIGGGAEGDTIDGGDGTDTLEGGAGDDIIDGGAGDDVITDAAGSDTLSGGDGNDRIIVVRGDGFLTPPFTTLRIRGGAGDDAIVLGRLIGPTDIVLGSGRDRIEVVGIADFTVRDFVAGAAGDTIDFYGILRKYIHNWNSANPFADGHLVIEQSGSSTLVKFFPELDNLAYITVTLVGVSAASLTAENFAGYAPDGSPPAALTLTGTIADDVLVAGPGRDVVKGLGGNDDIDGRAGNDKIDGGTGNDRLTGGYGDDTVNGGDGDDFIYDEVLGRDVLIGGAGNDTIVVTGYDEYIGRAYRVSIDGGDGDDVVTAITQRENTTIDLGAGDDLLTFSANDAEFTDRRTLTLGSGMDTLRVFDRMYLFRNAETAIVVTDFATGTGGDILDWRGFAENRLNYERLADFNPFADADASLVQRGSDVVLQIGSQFLIVFQNTRVENFVDANLGYELHPTPRPGVTYTGTAGADRFTGSSRGDTVILLGGNDLASGRGGADMIDGGAGDDALYAEEGNDTLVGGDGADFLNGGSGADRIEGGDGDDQIMFSDNSDSIDGGAGYDTFDMRSTASTGSGLDLDLREFPRDGTFLLGGNLATGIERLLILGGTNLADRVLYGALWTGQMFINAGGGDDIVLSTNGASNIFGGDGDDELTGLAGDDGISGDAGDDLLSGGAGRDNLIGDVGDDVMIGGDGDDFLSGGIGEDTVLAGSGDDLVTLDDLDAGDVLDGGSGRDTLRLPEQFSAVNLDLSRLESLGILSFNGQAVQVSNFEIVEIYLTPRADTVIYGADYRFAVTLDGQEGADRIVGGRAADTLSGGDGADSLDGGAGADHLVGGRGDDTYYIDTVGDRIDELSNDGYDRIFSSVDVSLSANVEAATLTGTTDINAYGNALNNVLIGNVGRNLFDGGAGNDMIDGGEGFDTVSYASSTAKVTIDLGRGRQPAGPAGADTLVSIEAVVGSAYADVLTGNGEANDLRGGRGDDRLTGRDGADYLVGGSGNDILNGGAGADSFVFDSGLGIDRIVDFERGVDRIVLDGSLFGLAPGALVAGMFRRGAVAKDADDHILYDTGTGALFFDVDGVGGERAVQIGRFDATPPILAADFLVI